MEEKATSESKQEKQVTIRRSSVLIGGLTIGAITLMFLGILIGQAVGERRAAHYGKWQQNYERNFFGSPLRMPGIPLGRSPIPLKGHALLGEVLTVDKNTISLKGRNDIEQSVLIDDQTIIRKDNEPGSRDDLTAGSKVAVFGRPNDEGQVQARLIRIFPDNENLLP